MRQCPPPQFSAKGSSSRAGHVTVEMAVILPLIFGLFLGSIELTRINAAINAAETAAYEGAREGMLPGASNKNVTDAAQLILDASMITKARIDVDPPSLSSRSDTVTVTITIPISDNTWGQDKHGKGKSVTRSCTLTRENTLAKGS